MSARICAICGALNAPLGFGLPGLRKDLPPKKRGYIWTCAAPDCTSAAEARRDGAIDRQGVTARKPTPDRPSAAHIGRDGTPRLL